MNWLIGSIPGLVAALTIVVFVYGYRLMTTDPELDLDDAEALYLVSKAKDKEGQVGLLDRLGDRLTPHLRALLPNGAMLWLRRQVDIAGRPDGMDADAVLSQIARWLIIATPLAVVMAVLGNFFVVGMAIIGAVGLPLLQLTTAARQRGERIDTDLPDFLDILAVTVSAGLAFRNALAVVAERFGGPLAEDVQVVLHQVANGATLRSAFSQLKDRTRSDSIDEFVTAYLQAEELGAPLVDTLNQIALDMRRANSQRLKQKAGRVEPRISLVMTIVIIPGTLFLLVGGMIVGMDFSSFGILGG